MIYFEFQALNHKSMFIIALTTTFLYHYLYDFFETTLVAHQSILLSLML